MDLDFYFWGFQCPLNNRVINILKGYEDKININYYDVSNDFDSANKMKMYFPTLIVVNKKYRYFSPMIKTQFLSRLCSGEYPKEIPYRPKHGVIEKNVNILPLTMDNLKVACKCTGQNCSEYRIKKERFLRKSNTKVFGYINVDHDNCLLGGAEYMPSVIVPYPIPQNKDSAYITCVYTTDSYYDYKSGPLKKLENYLKNQYNKVLVISDEKGTFPNGDLNFFLRNGYEDCGIISKEKDYCTLHLLSKTI